MLLSSEAASSITEIIVSHFPDVKSKPVFIPVSGGSINECFRVILAGKPDLFLKLNGSADLPLFFECEKTGLEYIKMSGFKTPEIVALSSNNSFQFLLLEWIPSGNKTNDFWKKFGEQLATLHQVSGDQFGFTKNNYIGSIQQDNTYYPDWISFYINQRLAPQVKLAVSKKLLGTHHQQYFEKLYSRLQLFFPEERPSLLHGDLWNGNYICNEQQAPVLIDPAIYFGHRCMDLAMAKLFGGFDPVFFNAYDYHFPLPVNYKDQIFICQLYPLLVHLNLFGPSYLADIEQVLHQYVRG